MFERDKYIIWEAGEVIYRAGDPSNEAFLIMEGSVPVSYTHLTLPTTVRV